MDAVKGFLHLFRECIESKPGIAWSIVSPIQIGLFGAIRGWKDERDYCPLTAVAEFYVGDYLDLGVPKEAGFVLGLDLESIETLVYVIDTPLLYCKSNLKWIREELLAILHLEEEVFPTEKLLAF